MCYARTCSAALTDVSSWSRLWWLDDNKIVFALSGNCNRVKKWTPMEEHWYECFNWMLQHLKETSLLLVVCASLRIPLFLPIYKVKSTMTRSHHMLINRSLKTTYIFYSCNNGTEESNVLSRLLGQQVCWSPWPIALASWTLTDAADRSASIYSLSDLPWPKRQFSLPAERKMM